MTRILTVVGARPQFVKASVVSRALARRPGLEEIIVDTGQHYDDAMNRIFFEELGIPRPRRFLGVGSGSHGEQTGRMLAALEAVMLEERPDWVLVYGDTNSTLAGTLAAAKLHLPVAHVEAGLRSFNRRMPEEINRVLTDHASALLFAPTDQAVENLRLEGIAGPTVQLVGDVMFDAALHFAAQPTDALARWGLEAGSFVLATVHRAENTDDPSRLNGIVQALSTLAKTEQVVLPLHPRTAKYLEAYGLRTALEARVTVTPPLGYLDMLTLERAARVIVTDSGGIQKEAFFQRVPCVTLRDETEWVELLEAGWNVLASPLDPQAVVGAVSSARPGRADAQLYGGGRASELIAQALEAGRPTITPTWT
ncbi:UDP-GlcNAc3NAcA epimerase [Deinobacterium chartae]|uniref:UDP-GlcNAc3NAcA epimerase n=1 Tax=Deinobacterium chartae TaxID=521158 RepID=A0A841I199_9DEIO|nr:UDP-N-acetylglucosamine 2-epimerase (non-hydrolyzing) [Deinobacterium chartae]MBB6097852.1 UDP-GlcNAc3NAcA epimerase [Deinobacterium chartae]